MWCGAVAYAAGHAGCLGICPACAARGWRGQAGRRGPAAPPAEAAASDQSPGVFDGPAKTLATSYVPGANVAMARICAT